MTAVLVATAMLMIALAGSMTVAAAAGTGRPSLDPTGPARPEIARPAVVADLPMPEPDPGQANREADDILARPEYAPPPQSIWDRIGSWIGDHLSDILRGVNGGAGGPIVWIVLALLVGALVFLLVRLRGGASLRRRERDDDPLFVTELEALRTPREWVTEAERLEGRGEWKAALRARFRALLGQLIDRGVLRDLPGRTTGEYRVELARSVPAVAADFQEASGLFDAAWYGDEPTGADENRRFVVLAEQVITGTRGRPEPAASGGGRGGLDGGAA